MKTRRETQLVAQTQGTFASCVSPLVAAQVKDRSVAHRLNHTVSLSIPVRRIVTFHPGELSSFLWTLPALQALREGYPGARISVVVRPSLAPFLRDSPLCDEVLERVKGGLSHQTSLMLQLRSLHPDVAVSFSRSRLSTLLAWSSGAEERIGFADARLDALLTQRLEYDDATAPESYNSLVQALGCTPRQAHARDLLTIDTEAEKRAQRALEENGVDGDFIVAMCDAASSEKVALDKEDDENEDDTNDSASVNNALQHLEQKAEHGGEGVVERAWQVGARVMQKRVIWPEKSIIPRRAGVNRAGTNSGAPETKSLIGNRRRIVQWPVAQWTQTLSELSGRAPVILVGATPAASVTCRLESHVVDLGGTLEPVVMAAILRRARLYVGSDSGVLHLAAAVGTPVVGIYGPTDWRCSGPRGVPHRIVRHEVECSPCELSRCLWNGDEERKCLTRLPSQQVVEAARELIGL